MGVRLRLGESAGGDDIYVVRPSSPPVNDHLMELLLLVDVLRGSSPAASMR